MGDRGGVLPPAPCKELMEVFFLKLVVVVVVELVEARDCVDGDRRILIDDLLEYPSSAPLPGIADGNGDAIVGRSLGDESEIDGSCGAILTVDSTGEEPGIGPGSSSCDMEGNHEPG